MGGGGGGGGGGSIVTLPRVPGCYYVTAIMVGHCDLLENCLVPYKGKRIQFIVLYPP